MLYLVAALALSIAMQPPLSDRVPFLRVVWPTYLHLLVVGWLTQLIFGVAFWLFPKPSSARTQRGERLGWTSFVLLNLGLLLRVLGEPRALLGGDAAGLLVSSAVAQLLAGWAFVANTWSRVRGR
ncbi:MAG: hypothetical protein ABI785_08575 [Gemmatimonadales bacterium]